MAAQFIVPTGSIALTAAANKTILEFPTGSSMPAVLYAVELSFSAQAAGSCTATWGTFTTTGTGTTVTAGKVGMDRSFAAVMGTIKIADTVEPSGFAAATDMPSLVIPLPGMYSIIYPQGRELYRPVSINTCLRVNSTLACNVFMTLLFEQ
jgi:hypothetical protein